MSRVTRSRFKDSRRPYFWCEKGLLRLGLRPMELAVYCVIAGMVDENDQCYPSYETIAARLGIDRRTVIRAVKRLCHAGALRKHNPVAEDCGRKSNLYELVDLPDSTRKSCPGGDTGVTGDMPDTPPVSPESPPQCHKCTSKEESLNEELENEGGTPPGPGSLIEVFASEFAQRYRHRPRITAKLQRDWAELLALHPETLLRAKIDGWWNHPLPPTFHGNRTLGAFLQWFDDIPVNGAPPVVPGTSRTADQWADEMRSGSLSGRQHYHELTAGISDPAAKRQTLRQYGGIHDDDVIDAIIAACGNAR